MLRKSFLITQNVVVSIHRSFARRIVSPRIVRVIENDNHQKNIPPLPFVDSKVDWDSIYSETELKVNETNKSKQSNKENDIPPYEKVNDKNNEFKSIMTKLSIKKRRQEMNLIVLEGKRLIQDAINAEIPLKYIFFTLEENIRGIENLNDIIAKNGTKLLKVLYKDMKLFSSLVTSPGIMAVAQQPNNQMLIEQDSSQKMPLTLVCDNIRDPGNLGTIIRTSAAVGIEKLILTVGCVDAWNSKVLKSASGAHFRTPLYTNIEWNDLTNHLPEKYDLYIADSNTKENSHELLDSLILIIGNEAFGISSQSYELAEKTNGCRIKIPLYNNVDSLNSAVASSILLYEIRRQFKTK
ncbi:SpoU rRNA Methylase [Blomia tropicalis]|nr:SpoU rRNA Methylase [Blomia tropicalis]